MKNTLVSTEVADCYQVLFNLLSKEHNLTLTISEMDEVIKSSHLVISKINELNNDSEKQTNIDKIIEVQIFAHSSVIDDTISFEEGDLSITNIGKDEYLQKEDFNLLFEALSEIETKELEPDKWHIFKFIRSSEQDDYNKYYYFELVD